MALHARAALDENALDERKRKASEADEEVTPPVKDRHQFPELVDEYKPLDKLGQGTYAIVWRAISLGGDNQGAEVALKRFKVQHNKPSRVSNEAQMLIECEGLHNVVKLEGVLRSREHIAFVLPYFKHDSFRENLLRFDVPHTLTYIGGLFESLAHAHASRVLHRDVKPSNALYSFERREMLLVDFGLAERMRAPRPSPPARATGSAAARGRAVGSGSGSAARASGAAGRVAAGAPPSGAFGGGAAVSRRSAAENLPSPPRTRAGTKGFRAPECLLGVDERTGAVDVWSAGVILLSVLTRQYPFFSAADDTDQLWEIALLRGAKPLRAMAREFGKGLDFTSPLAAPESEWMREEPEDLEALSVRSREAIPPSRVRAGLIALADGCLDVNPRTRITAEAAHAAICALRALYDAECATEPADGAPAAEAAAAPAADAAAPAAEVAEPAVDVAEPAADAAEPAPRAD